MEEPATTSLSAAGSVYPTASDSAAPSEANHSDIVFAAAQKLLVRSKSIDTHGSIRAFFSPAIFPPGDKGHAGAASRLLTTAKKLDKGCTC